MWSIYNESTAIAVFYAHIDMSMVILTYDSSSGCRLHSTHPFLGSSPDRAVLALESNACCKNFVYA